MDYRNNSQQPASRAPRVLLIGDSGVGKTTFVNSLNRVLRRSAAGPSDGGAGGVGASPRGGAHGSGYGSPAPMAAAGSSSSALTSSADASVKSLVPSTIGLASDAICIKYGGATKAVETVEIGGNRTFSLTARSVAYKSPAAAIFLFYRTDAPESIVALGNWYEEVRREILDSQALGTNTVYNENGGGNDRSLFPPSSRAMSFYGGEDQNNISIRTPNSQFNGSNTNSDTSLMNRGGQHSSNSNIAPPAPFAGGAPNPVKLVLVAITDPKAKRKGGVDGACSRDGMWGCVEGGGGGMSSPTSANGASLGEEPIILFRGTAFEPAGRLLARAVRFVWHLTMVLLSVLLLGPGQTVVPIKPPNLHDIIRKIEHDPFFCQTVALEFSPLRNHYTIEFGDSLDDVVQLLATLSVS